MLYNYNYDLWRSYTSRGLPLLCWRSYSPNSVKHMLLIPQNVFDALNMLPIK